MSDRILTLAWIIVLHAGIAQAQIPQLPEPPIEAVITVSNPTPFERETFQVTLTLVARGVELHQQIDLAGLPDRARIAILEPFEALPIERDLQSPTRTETRRYRTRARALQTGETTIGPLLQLRIQRRVRSFFGSVIEEQPLNIQSRPARLTVRPLPPPPEDFCGAVGALNVAFSVSPTNLSVGDLVTVDIRIQGEGYLENLRIPAVAETSLLKTYPVKPFPAEPGQRQFSQTVIPQSETLREIPALRLTVFDTVRGEYVTHSAGPFALRYQRVRTRVVEQFRPSVRPEGGAVTAQAARRLADGLTARLSGRTSARWAPSAGSRETFTIPAGETVRVYRRREDWLLIEYRRNRGWIPPAAIGQP